MAPASHAVRGVNNSLQNRTTNPKNMDILEILIFLVERGTFLQNSYLEEVFDTPCAPHLTPP